MKRMTVEQIFSYPSYIILGKGYKTEKVKFLTFLEDDCNPVHVFFLIFNQMWAAKEIINFYKSIEKRMRDFVILDLGCYRGHLYTLLAYQHHFFRYIGIDLYKYYLENAIKFSPNKVKFIAHDLNLGIPIADNQVDVVVALEILEHLPREKSIFLIKEIYRVLRKPGLFLVSIPANTREHKFHEYHIEKEKFGHVTFFTDEELVDIAISQGFKLEKLFWSYGIRCKWQIPNEIKNNPMFQVIKERYGTQVARAFAMAASKEPTGALRVVFLKEH